MDPRRKLQVVSAANPSLRVSAAPKQISIVQPKNNTQIRVAQAPQQNLYMPDGRLFVPSQKTSTPAPQPTIQKPKQSLWNRVTDVFDANSQADQYRRYMANQEKVRIGGQNAPGQVPIIDENPGNIISNTIGAVPRMFNTAANQIVEVGYTAQQQFATREYSNAVKDLLAAQKSGNRTWYEAAKRRADAAAQRVSNIEDMIKATKSNYTENKGGLFNAGTLYNEQDSYEGKLTTGLRKIGGGTAEGMFDVASLGLTGVAGKQVAKQGLKQTLKESGKIIAKNAALNTGQGMASSFRQGGDVKDIALSGAVSGVVGTGADVALAGGGGFIARNISKLKNKLNPFEKQVTKYLTQESSETAIKSILESGFNVPVENLDAITKYVATETNEKAIDKLVKELSIDPNLELTPDVIKQLQDNGIKEVKRDANAQYEAQYKDGGITARGQAELDKYVYQELGHHIYLNRLTPEEKLLFKGEGVASKKSVGRTGYTQDDINSEDFTDYFDKAMRGRIDEVPAEYQAVIRKYANIADEIAATDNVPIGTKINTSPQTPTNTTKVPVGNLGGIDAIRATVKTKESAVQRVAEAQAEIDKILQSGDTSEVALSKIDNLQKTIDDLKVVEQELPSETVIAQQGVNTTTVDEAGQQLSGVAPQQIDNAAKTAETASLATDTSTDAVKVADKVSEAATIPQKNTPLDPIVNEKTGETLSQAVEKLRANKWSEKDIQRYIDAVNEPNSAEIVKNATELNELNPTGTIFADYTPKDRATLPLGSDMTTVDKTLGGSPNDLVTIYRGVDKQFSQNDIQPGDFVTTLPDLAKAYAGDGNVISMQVKKGDLLDSKIDPVLGEETIYRPGAYKELQATEQSLIDTGNPETVAKDVGQRGFAKSLSQTDTPPEVYENLLGYQSRPNTETFDMASKAIETDEQGVLQSILSKNQGALTDDETAQALLLLDKAIKNDQLQLAEQIAGKINVSGTENGRAVQILAAVRKTTPEGAYLEAQKIITEAQEKGLLPKDFKLPKETTDAIQAQAQYIQDLKAYNNDLGQYVDSLDPNSSAYSEAARELAQSTREYELSIAVLGKTLKDIVPPTVGDKLNSLVNISLLLNPKTFIRNVIGNAANATGEAISSTISTPLDILASLRTGNRTVKLPNILKRFGGFGRGLKEGAQETELGVRIGGGGKYDINPAVFKSKVMSRIEKTLGHSLSDMDKAFATAQFDETLDSLMRANKVTKPTQEMLDIAENEALYATFQHDSFIARSLMGAKQWLNKAQVKGFGLGDVVVRYPKTPGNLVAVGMDYSPYGFFKGLVQFAKLNQGSNLAAQRAAVRNLGRGITGTGLITGGYILAQNGIITARKDSDKDVNSLQRNQGQPPFSFNITALGRLLRGEDTAPKPGDVIANYDWLQPNAIQLSMGANMALNKDAGNKDWISSTLDQAAMGLETIEEQPVLAQTGRFFQTATTPADRGGGIPNAIKDSVVGLPSMFVPSVLNQTAASIDNQARTSYDPNPIKQATNKVVAKLPFASKSLEPVVDTFGNEVKRQQTDNPVTRVFNSFVNPAFVTKLNQTPEGQMVLDLYNKTGEKGQFPRVTDRKMQINGESYSLSPKEITEFQKFTGKETEKAFADLANNPGFMNLSDDEKIKIMSGIITDISSAARIKILGNEPKTLTNDVKAILGGKTAGFQSKIPEGVNDIAKKYYEKTTFMDQETYDGWLKGEPDQIATEVASDLNKRRPANTNELTAYNGLAKRYAEYEKAKAEAKKDGSWTKLDEKEKEQEFWKGAIKDSRDDLTKDIYDAGSSGSKDYWEQGLISKEDITKAIALDDELYRSGLSKTLKFSKTFRRQYGYGIPTAPGEKASGSGGSGGGGGRASKKTGVNELKLRYTPDAAPTVSRVPRNVQLKLNKPAPVQVTPVRIRL